MVWHDSLRLSLLNADDPAELSSRIEHDQIKQVFTLFRSGNTIQEFNEFIDRQQTIERDYAAAGLKWQVKQHSPISLASDILDVLNCSSVDEYFDRFTEYFGNEIYTELQPGGGRHSEFREFVERSLRSQK